jgi:hypothetical protein
MWGGGMLLFIPLAVGQTLGGFLYEYNPAIPFVLMSAGLIPIILWAHFKVKDPKTIEK